MHRSDRERAEDGGMNGVRNPSEYFISLLFRERDERTHRAEGFTPIPEKIEEDEKGQDDLNQHPNRAGSEFRGSFTDLACHALELTAQVDLLLKRGKERP